MRYAALFRGINVGGKNRVKMDELTRLLHGLGLGEVKTYIQSGNAVFESELDGPALQKAISAGFAARFGFESAVMLRSADEMGALIGRLPFPADEIAAAEAAAPDAEHLYVYFLEHPPGQAALDALSAWPGPDLVRPGARELYLLCHESVRLSKLAIRAAKEFGPATVRNWNTVQRLCDMLTEH